MSRHAAVRMGGRGVWGHAGTSPRSALCLTVFGWLCSLEWNAFKVETLNMYASIRVVSDFLQVADV